MNVTKSYVTMKKIFTQTIYMHNFYYGGTMTNKLKMRTEMISKIRPGNHTHKRCITYKDKLRNGTEPKYKKAREIASKTMCNNTDPNIFLPH